MPSGPSALALHVPACRWTIEKCRAQERRRQILRERDAASNTRHSIDELQRPYVQPHRNQEAIARSRNHEPQQASHQRQVQAAAHRRSAELPYAARQAKHAAGGSSDRHFLMSPSDTSDRDSDHSGSSPTPKPSNRKRRIRPVLDDEQDDEDNAHGFAGNVWAAGSARDTTQSARASWGYSPSSRSPSPRSHGGLQSHVEEVFGGVVKVRGCPCEIHAT
jgi:hypothetical protein